MASSDLPENVRRGRDAALEFLPMLVRVVAPDRNLYRHAGTLLAAAAWLTGTSLYRSFNFKDESSPGTIIKSEEVNKEWESLMYLVEEYNLGRTDIPVGRLMMVAMKLPDSLKPQMEMLQVQAELQESYNAVMKKHGFDYLDGARAGIVLCSIFLQHYSTEKTIDPYVAAGIIAERVLEAAKTVPPPLKD